MTQSKKIAVTGGIGSGKSYVCALLKARGYPVFSCDEVNRALWEDGEYLRALAALFPACTSGGEIDRNKLTKTVFSDREQLARLNEFSHPRIMEVLLARMNGERGTCFAEVPLLFEGGYAPLFDGVIALRRPQEARLQAVAARDGLSEAEIVARMKAQFPPEKLEQTGCYILENDGSAQTLAARLDRILQKLEI